jgi:hypothetical protein
MKKLSRRQLIGTGVAASIAMCAAPTPACLFSPGGGAPKGLGSVRQLLHGPQRDLLRAAIDEIVPAQDAMPAASQVGGVEYIEQLTVRDTKLASQLLEALSHLERLSQERFGLGFVGLSGGQRITALSELEGRSSESFGALRDSVYEGYYEQPSVWKLIGYEFYPTDGEGPKVRPFDSQILSEVAKKPAFYRGV